MLWIQPYKQCYILLIDTDINFIRNGDHYSLHLQVKVLGIQAKIIYWLTLLNMMRFIYKNMPLSVLFPLFQIQFIIVIAFIEMGKGSRGRERGKGAEGRRAIEGPAYGVPSRLMKETQLPLWLDIGLNVQHLEDIVGISCTEAIH